MKYVSQLSSVFPWRDSSTEKEREWTSRRNRAKAKPWNAFEFISTFPSVLHIYKHPYPLPLTRHQQATRHFCRRSQENTTNAYSFSLWFQQHITRKHTSTLTLLINLWHFLLRLLRCFPLLFSILSIYIYTRWYRSLFVLLS